MDASNQVQTSLVEKDSKKKRNGLYYEMVDTEFAYVVEALPEVYGITNG